MAASKKPKGKKVADYRHEDATRVNNPPAGLAWQDTEKPEKRRFEYDPHLDPQLVWAGKAERQSFEVEAPSIHVHERLSADDILKSVMREPMQPALFDYEELDRSKVVDFYRHEMGWENRLILGDSLVVMTSLLEKERLGGQVQMIYIDPPYGIRYSSNFQARISSRVVSDTSDDSVSREPEQISAYRDTWTLGIHSYLTYLRDRLSVAHELLAPSGSLFLQISDQNLHVVRVCLEEVFGSDNFIAVIPFRKKGMPLGGRFIEQMDDFLIWYAKDKAQAKYRKLFKRQNVEGDWHYQWAETPEGEIVELTDAQVRNHALLPDNVRLFRLRSLEPSGPMKSGMFTYEFRGVNYPHPKNGFGTTPSGMRRLEIADRLGVDGNRLNYKLFADDYSVTPLTAPWQDTIGPRDKRFVVQTGDEVVQRCICMTTDPGDLVVDPTCGGGTTAFVSERMGRRWITCDTSRVAVAVTRERLLTARLPYFVPIDSEHGVDGGLKLEQAGHLTMSSIAGCEALDEIDTSGEDGRRQAKDILNTLSEPEILFDKPEVDPSRVRLSGPFTVEALSRYAVNPVGDNVPPEPDDAQANEPQNHVATLLDALTRQGIPRKGDSPAKVLTIEPATSSDAIHAEGEYEAEDGVRKLFAVSIGPRFGPITVRQIDEALHDAYGYDVVVFAGYAATAEAQQYVVGGKVGRFQVALLEANPDLLVADLLKQTPSSQTFRLFAAPDVKLNAKDDGQFTVEVLGVDLFDAATGETKFVGDEYVAAWFLDTDYDGIVFRTRQAFFPNGGWDKLGKTLKGTVDVELMEQLERFESIPFEAGESKKAAVRVVDDAGTTSEVVLDLD